ncbi:MAG: hypothetical protein ACOYON_06490 [Fimbriimonas sp.]
MNWKRVQVAFDRAYWPLVDLTERVRTARSTERSPVSFIDFHHESLRKLSRRLDELETLCPVRFTLEAQAQFRRVDAAFAMADQLIDQGEARMQILDALMRLRDILDTNGVGLAPIPWYQAWKRLL